MSDACYVYGIVRAETRLDPEVTGAGMGEDVELVRAGALAAVVEGIDPARPIGTRRDLVAHSGVLDAVARLGAVIPLRFGTVVTDAAAVADDLLAPQEEELTAVLAGLEGRAQYTIRARYELDVVLAEVVRENPEVAALREQTSTLPEDVAHPDRIRLGELVAQAVQAKREQEGAGVVDTLLPFAVEANLREGGGMDHLVDVAYLVADDHRDGFEEAAEVLARDLAGRVRLRMVGPMAPYDFVPEG